MSENEKHTRDLFYVALKKKMSSSILKERKQVTLTVSKLAQRWRLLVVVILKQTLFMFKIYVSEERIQMTLQSLSFLKVAPFGSDIKT